jgi:hypothetical protein
MHAIQRFHQRRFSGAIFADDCVDRSRPNKKFNVVVGDHARKSLGDAVKLDG